MGALGGSRREGGIVAVNADRSVSLADHSRTLDVTAGAGGVVTITLPAASTLPDGFVCVVRRNPASSNNVALAGGFSRTLTGAAEGCICECSGSDWIYYPTQGPQGIQGEQGPPGADGADGADGATGQGVPTGGTAGQGLIKQSATDFDTAWGNVSADFWRAVCDFRLTLESGVPVSTSNQEAKTTLYLTPFIGRQIGLYYASAWKLCESSEVSISLSGKTASKNNDVFAYWNGSAVVLELVEWTNDSTRATALATQDGIAVKSGDATRRYVGTIRTTATTGQCEDSFTKRFVWNAFNRRRRKCFTTNTTNSWTYTTGSWREANAGTGQLRFQFVCGDAAVVSVVSGQEITGGSGAYAGVGLDAIASSLGAMVVSASYVMNGPRLGQSEDNVSAGYHWITLCEYGTATTPTYYGYGSTTNVGYGVQVSWET